MGTQIPPTSSPDHLFYKAIIEKLDTIVEQNKTLIAQGKKAEPPPAKTPALVETAPPEPKSPPKKKPRRSSTRKSK